MTENKRFYTKQDGNGKWTVSDRLNQFSMPISSFEFCAIVEDALNKLWSQVWRFEKHNQELVQRSIKYEDKIDELKNENEKLKCQISEDFNQSNCITVQKSIIDDLKKENEQLKQEIATGKEYCKSLETDLKNCAETRIELQERNNRQAEQLNKIYTLIEKEDWKALKNIIDDFKESEKLIKKEWECY